MVMPAKQKQKPKKDKNNHLDKVIIPWKLSDTQFILCKKVAIFTLLKKKKKKKIKKVTYPVLQGIFAFESRRKSSLKIYYHRP